MRILRDSPFNAPRSRMPVEKWTWHSLPCYTDDRRLANYLLWGWIPPTQLENYERFLKVAKRCGEIIRFAREREKERERKREREKERERERENTIKWSASPSPFYVNLLPQVLLNIPHTKSNNIDSKYQSRPFLSSRFSGRVQIGDYFT